MQKNSTYKAAQAVASDIEAHFVQHLSEMKKSGNETAPPLPKSKTIEQIIDIAFWASLLKEEGKSPKISLVLLPPDRVAQPLVFAEQIILSPHSLIKLSPGFERPGIHLGVWHDKGELYVWGATNTIPCYCFVLNVPEPGLLVIKHRKADQFGKFTNVAVLHGDEVKILDEQSNLIPDCPTLLTSLLGFHSDLANNDSINVVLQLAVSMRAHGRGGSLIIVPKGSEHWLNSIRQPIHYAVQPAFSALNELLHQGEEQKKQDMWQITLKKEIEEVAGLTAIDGAVVMNSDYELLAFGTKIIRVEGSSLPDQILLTEPVLGQEGRLVQSGLNGGTRHISATQFVYDQRDCLVLVASQDGRFTVFSWSASQKMVRAHRIETLLL
jgi:hypothetical protein